MADKKCAPNVEYKDGSCLSISLLKHIAENENKKNPNDKIKISDNKKELVDTCTDGRYKITDEEDQMYGYDDEIDEKLPTTTSSRRRKPLEEVN
jgi:hypothetical protein